MKEQKQVFNIEVPIPADMVLISRSEYLDLIQKEEVGQWWTIDKVEELLSISKTKLVNDILLNPTIKKKWILNRMRKVLFYILKVRVHHIDF